MKGATYGHAVPGYERRHKKVLDAENHLLDVKEGFQEKFVDGTDKIIDQLRSAMAAQNDHLRRYQTQYDEIQNHEARYRQLEEDLGKSTQRLINQYRKLNTQARSDKPPIYFSSDFDVSGIFETEAPNELTPPHEIRTRAENHDAAAQTLLVELKAEHRSLREYLGNDEDV